MQGKSFDPLDSIASHEHEYFCLIWKLVKLGKHQNLDGRKKIVAGLMIEHAQYQYFWEVPYAFASTELEEAFAKEGVNPNLHLEIEAMIMEQLESGNPPEIRQAYNALLRIGTEPHEGRHVIGRVFTEMLWEGSRLAKAGKQPDEDFYLRKLRRLAKNPKKIIKDQERELQQGS